MHASLKPRRPLHASQRAIVATILVLDLMPQRRLCLPPPPRCFCPLVRPINPSCLDSVVDMKACLAFLSHEVRYMCLGLAQAWDDVSVTLSDNTSAVRARDTRIRELEALLRNQQGQGEGPVTRPQQPFSLQDHSRGTLVLGGRRAGGLAVAGSGAAHSPHRPPEAPQLLDASHEGPL